MDFKRGEEIVFTFDGKPVSAFEGETVAVALYAANVRKLATSHDKHRARGIYCAIGNCASCMMIVDGTPNVKTCVEPVRAGMVVESQPDKGKLT